MQSSQSAHTVTPSAHSLSKRLMQKRSRSEAAVCVCVCVCAGCWRLEGVRSLGPGVTGGCESQDEGTLCLAVVLENQA